MLSTKEKYKAEKDGKCQGQELVALRRAGLQNFAECLPYRRGKRDSEKVSIFPVNEMILNSAALTIKS